METKANFFSRHFPKFLLAVLLATIGYLAVSCMEYPSHNDSNQLKTDESQHQRPVVVRLNNASDRLGRYKGTYLDVNVITLYYRESSETQGNESVLSQSMTNNEPSRTHQ